MGRGWTRRRRRRADASWFAVVIALIRQDHGHQSLWRRLSLIAGALILLELGFALSGVAFQTSLGLPLTLPTIDLAIAIFGLTLVENLMRNLPASRKWSLRFHGNRFGDLLHL